MWFRAEELPMAVRQLIPWLALGHGIFNTTMMVVFFYQGALGFRIRKARRSSAPVSFALVKRHRRLGPAAAFLGVAGFFLGTTIVTLDKGRPGEYPLHFVLGLVLALSIAAAYAVSRRIKGKEDRFRNIHTGLGTTLLVLYAVQSFLGLGILL